MLSGTYSARSMELAREELVLVPSTNTCGFKGVTRQRDKFQAMAWDGGRQRFLGLFDTAEEAAVAYARRVGKERAAREAAAARGEGPQALTAAQARTAALRLPW